MKKLIFIFPILSGIMWGSTGIFVRGLSDLGLNNNTIISSRILLAVLILGIGILLYDKSLLKIKIKDLWMFIVGGVIGMFGMSFCYNEAISEVTLSLAAVLLSTSPAFVLVFAAVIFKEKITIKKIVCMVMALTGCIFASGVLEVGSGMKWSVYGIITGFACAIFYATYSIITKLAMEKGYDPLTITIYSLLSMLVVILPFTDWSAISSAVATAPVNVSIFMVAHSLATAILPYVFYTVSIKYIEAGKASILASGEAIAAMIFGVLFYNEIPTALSLTGLALTFAALTMLSLPEKQMSGNVNVEKVN